MPSHDAVIQAFDLLRSAGLQPPQSVKDAPAKAVTAYALVLSDATDEDVLHAVVGYLQGGARFWPSAGELRGRVPARADLEAGWGEGWAILVRAASRAPGGTFYGQPPERFSADPVTDRAVRAGMEAIGGWRAYGMLEQEQEGTARAHFRDAFLAAQVRARRDAEYAVTRRALEGAGMVARIEAEPEDGTWRRAEVIPMRRDEP